MEVVGVLTAVAAAVLKTVVLLQATEVVVLHKLDLEVSWDVLITVEVLVVWDMVVMHTVAAVGAVEVCMAAVAAVAMEIIEVMEVVAAQVMSILQWEQ